MTSTFIHPNIAMADPLMVVGAPRCGTRFVANVLNKHPDIHLHGEVLDSAMEATVRFFQEANSCFASQDVSRTLAWEQTRLELVYSIWSSILKKPMKPFSRPVKWFGHKTPRHDYYWEFYRDFLGQDVKYVFCLRNFVSHYLSSYAMKPKPIEQVAKLYRESMTRYHRMKGALGDNVSLFILDDLSDGGLDYLRTVLFDNLNIPVDDTILGKIDLDKKANSSASRGWSVQRRRELTPKEQSFIEKNPDLVTSFEALRQFKKEALVINR